MMVKWSIDHSQFSLQHPDVNLFHRSEWSPPACRPVWYMVYRITVALLMVSGVSAHAITTADTLGVKWFIYMTNQGITLLTLHYVLYAIIVIRATMQPNHVIYGSLPFSYRVSWALQNLSSSSALLISLIYWTALHPYVVKYHLMTSAWASFLNVFLHGLNSVSFLIDIFVSARPVRIHHFYFAVLFGIYYMVFSIVYWQAGGTGRCAVRCWSIHNTTTTPTMTTTTISTSSSPTTAAFTPFPCNEVVCDQYIYPILDWESDPWTAVLTVVLGMLIMPLVQAAWWGCYRIRTWAGGKWDRRGGEEKMSGESIVSYREHQVVTSY